MQADERASRKRARNRPNLPQPRILLLCLSLNSAFVCVKVTLTFYTRRAARAAERNVRKRRTLYMMCGLSSDNERTKGAGRVRFTLDPAGEWMEGWKDAYFYKSAFFLPLGRWFFSFYQGVHQRNCCSGARGERCESGSKLLSVLERTTRKRQIFNHANRVFPLRWPVWNRVSSKKSFCILGVLQKVL
jgi:hypothetical protein